MSGDYLFLMEMLLVFGFAVGLGCLELYLLHRSKRRDAEKARRDGADRDDG